MRNTAPGKRFRLAKHSRSADGLERREKVLDTRLSGVFRPGDGHHVEPRGIAQQVVPFQIGQGQSRDAALLVRAHALTDRLSSAAGLLAERWGVKPRLKRLNVFSFHGLECSFFSLDGELLDSASALMMTESSRRSGECNKADAVPSESWTLGSPLPSRVHGMGSVRRPLPLSGRSMSSNGAPVFFFVFLVTSARRCSGSELRLTRVPLH